jgi:hypothetical protein
MDVFDELDPSMDKFFKDLEDMWGVKNHFTRPQQKEAAYIWDACGFHSRVTEHTIESGLWDWVSRNGYISKKNDSYIVSWKSNTFLFTASWSAFYKWFLCTLSAK